MISVATYYNNWKDKTRSAATLISQKNEVAERWFTIKVEIQDHHVILGALMLERGMQLKRVSSTWKNLNRAHLTFFGPLPL